MEIDVEARLDVSGVGAMIGHTEKVPVSLPAGLGELEPGGQLAGVLMDVPVGEISGFDTVELAEAAYRQATHSRAVFLRAVAESGMRAPGSVESVERVEHPSEFAADEVRAALAWSRTRAESTFWFAHSVFVRLPILGEAMLTGVLDEPRAKAFVDWTAGLSDEHAARVCDELLGAAPSLLVGRLIDRIKRLAISLDPEWAQRRYDDAVKGRRVESWQSPEGTANVAGRDLPAERAQAGTERINTLARAAKSAGDGRAMDAIRADLFLGMLDGQFVGLSDQEIVAHLLEHPIADSESSGPTGPDAEPDDEPGSAAETNDAGRRDGEPGEPAEDGGESGLDADDLGHEPASAGAEPAPDSGAWNVSELRVELGTLLGLDRHPAELPGLGVVPAGVALGMLPRMLRGEWRFVVCGDDGVPICSGITSARPRLESSNASPDPRGRGVVELQLTSAQLFRWRAEAVDGRHAAWSAVISDIAEQVEAGSLDGTSSNSGYGDVAGGHDGADSDGEAASDAHRRVARAGLRRWIEVRDRFCLHPACRMPATRTDQDHRIDYAVGGPTTAINLDSFCRHDHRLVHEAGWTTRRGDAGELILISGLGHTYVTRPPPAMTIYPDPEPGIADPA